VEELGSSLERHDSFPNRTNVEFAQLVDSGHIMLRVWERGVGETKACGTGASAAAVAALQTGRAGTPMEIILPGGILKISVDDEGHVHMAGPAVEVYSGELDTGWIEKDPGGASRGESG